MVDLNPYCETPTPICFDAICSTVCASSKMMKSFGNRKPLSRSSCSAEQEERESGFLFPNDFIIFDEAHTVEQIASKQIGIGVSQYGLRSTIQRLYNARTRKG